MQIKVVFVGIAKKIKKNKKIVLTKSKTLDIIQTYLSDRYKNKRYGILAQLGEHLPYKQRVIGSSPIGPIVAR